MSAGAVELAIEQLRAQLGEKVVTSDAVCEAHGQDESYHALAAPQAVVFAHTTDDVVATVKMCQQYAVPLIPFGGGTSLEGHVQAIHGGISLDLMHMNAVLTVNQSDLDCVVEAGVTRKQLNTHLRDTGLFFPVDPGADASLGGMCATGASGTTTVRYGTMRDNVLGLTCVMPNGDVVSMGGRARKSSAGYDLTRLMVGSEGTLGVITELRLRLFGIPESVSSCVCAFGTLEGAVEAVILTIQMGLPVARIELLDECQIAASNAYSNLDLEEAPTLFIEFHGTEQSVVADVDRFRDISGEHGAKDFHWATQEEDRNRLWTARHNAAYAVMNMRPGLKFMTTDVCVPISRLAECILATRSDLDQTALYSTILGHVGDGNFHVLIMFDEQKAGDVRAMEEFNARLIDRALAMGGTCTGEHGIGLGKKPFLVREHGDTLPLMRSIKSALDPQNIMNPGKIFDR